ncbi:MAG: ATP-binding protein [Sodalinema sp.]|uniref:ATP-binding protein n=1 Tax=Sodalinema sp. TaxID=3080550 RepID=UPI0012174DD5|nr:MAG: hybrid sensor histidine kinase/response regulator [Phormidium sp. SL48-SHIP]
MSNAVITPIKKRIQRLSSRIPLRLVLVIPFLLEITVIVGLTGWFSLNKGRQAVHNLVSRLAQEKSDRIETEIAKFLDVPLTVNQATARAIARETIDVSNVRNLQPLFWDQLQSFPSINAISFGEARQGHMIRIAAQPKTPPLDPFQPDTSYFIEYADAETNGELISFSVDILGRMTTGLRMQEEFDARDRPWYRRTIGLGHSNWSQLYRSLSQAAYDALVITASQPIYDENHVLLGVAAVTLRLKYISTVLNEIDIAGGGQAYIVDSTGQLIGISDGSDPLNAIQSDVDDSHQIERPYARHSHHSVIAQSAQYLEEEFGHWSQITEQKNLYFKTANQGYFLQVRLIRDNYGVRWRSVVIIPEANFMQEIEDNQRLTLLLCAIALIVAGIIGWLTARWLTRPLLQLSRISQDIANGKRDRTIPQGGIREISQLSQSFAEMTQQLNNSFESLEDKVAARTAQLQEAKQTADAANAAKSKFIANMSHELRTPLNGILGYAQILMHSQQLTPLETKQLNSLYHCGNHLLNLINDILDFAKIESGELTIHPRLVSLSKLLNTVVEICQVKANEKWLNLQINASPEIPAYILVDDKRLKQVTINLLGNAIKFTDCGGTIEFHISRLDSPLDKKPKDAVSQAISQPQATPIPQPISQQTVCLRFEVIDSGIGIAESDLERIFHPFEQVSSPERNSDGTGLGLVIVQEILHRMGSELEVESQLGSGSCFRFDLELQIDQYQPVSENGATVIESSTGPATNLQASGIPEELPEPEDLAQLLHLAKRGSLNRLGQELDAIAEKHENLHRFCQHYRRLIERFQVRQLVQELEQDVQAKSRSQERSE